MADFESENNQDLGGTPFLNIQSGGFKIAPASSSKFEFSAADLLAGPEPEEFDDFEQDYAPEPDASSEIEHGDAEVDPLDIATAIMNDTESGVSGQKNINSVEEDIQAQMFAELNAVEKDTASALSIAADIQAQMSAESSEEAMSPSAVTPEEVVVANDAKDLVVHTITKHADEPQKVADAYEAVKSDPEVQKKIDNLVRDEAFAAILPIFRAPAGEKIAAEMAKKSKKKSSSIGEYFANMLREMRSFAKSAFAPVKKLKGFFTEKSSGISEGVKSSNARRPAFKLAHVLGIAAVSSVLTYNNVDNINKAAAYSSEKAETAVQSINEIGMQVVSNVNGNSQRINDFVTRNVEQSLISIGQIKEVSVDFVSAGYNAMAEMANYNSASTPEPSSEFKRALRDFLIEKVGNAEVVNSLYETALTTYAQEADISSSPSVTLMLEGNRDKSLRIVGTGSVAPNIIVLSADNGFKIYGDQARTVYSSVESDPVISLASRN